MAITMKSAKPGGLAGAIGGTPVRQEVEILADTEADITALTEIVTDQYGNTAIPFPGSMAYTADMSVVYQLSPSGTWTKVV